MGDYPSWGFDAGAQLCPGRNVVRALGGGRRCEALLVRDTRAGEAVAKVLRPGRAGEPRAVRALEREARLLERLDHPALPRLLDARPHGACPHILIERFGGPTLRRALKRNGPLAPAAAAALGAELAAALAHVAARDCVHLDVKPANVILDERPRLIDLGIARSLERAARTQGPVGTAAYQSPEQCADPRAPGPIGPAADAWGLGATLFHAVAGRRPFPRGERDATGERRYRQLVEPPRPLPDGLPAELRDLILGLLARDPAQRPSAAEAASRLGRLAAAPV